MNDAITLKEMMESYDDFIADCEDEELSDNTLISYSRVAKLLIEHLSSDHSPDDLIRKKDMIAWKKSLSQYEIKTQYDYIVYANKFTRYCCCHDNQQKHMLSDS